MCFYPAVVSRTNSSCSPLNLTWQRLQILSANCLSTFISVYPCVFWLVNQCVFPFQAVCLFVWRKGKKKSESLSKRNWNQLRPKLGVHGGHCWRIHACIYNPSTSAFLEVQSHMAAHTVLSAHSASYCVTWSMETLLVRVKLCWFAVCLPCVLICSVKSSKVKWLSQNLHFMSPCPHPLQLRMHSPNIWVTPTVPASDSMSFPNFPPSLSNRIQIFSQCTAALFEPWPSWRISRRTHPTQSWQTDLLSWLCTDVSGSVFDHHPAFIILQPMWDWGNNEKAN